MGPAKSFPHFLGMRCFRFVFNFSCIILRRLNTLHVNFSSPGFFSHALQGLVDSGNQSLTSLRDVGFGFGPMTDCPDGKSLIAFANKFGSTLQDLALPLYTPWKNEWLYANFQAFLSPFTALTSLCMPYPQQSLDEQFKFPTLAEFNCFVRKTMPRMRALSFYFEKSTSGHTEPVTIAKLLASALDQKSGNPRTLVTTSDSWLPFEALRDALRGDGFVCANTGVAILSSEGINFSFLQLAALFCSAKDVELAMDCLVADGVPSLDVNRTSDLGLLASFLSGLRMRGNVDLFEAVLNHPFIGLPMRQAIEQWAFSSDQALRLLPAAFAGPAALAIGELMARCRNHAAVPEAHGLGVLLRVQNIFVEAVLSNPSLKPRDKQLRIGKYVLHLQRAGQGTPSLAKLIPQLPQTAWIYALCCLISGSSQFSSLEVISRLLWEAPAERRADAVTEKVLGRTLMQYGLEKLSVVLQMHLDIKAASETARTFRQFFQELIQYGADANLPGWPGAPDSCTGLLQTLITFLEQGPQRSRPIVVGILEGMRFPTDYTPTAARLLDLILRFDLTALVPVLAQFASALPGMGFEFAPDRFMSLFKISVQFPALWQDKNGPHYKTLVNDGGVILVSERDQALVIDLAYEHYHATAELEFLTEILQAKSCNWSPQFDMLIFRRAVEAASWQRTGVALTLFRVLRSLPIADQSVDETRAFYQFVSSPLFSDPRLVSHALLLLRRFPSELQNLRDYASGRLLQHYAVETGELRILETLFDETLFPIPLNWHAKDKLGRNPLHYMANLRTTAAFFLRHPDLLPLFNEADSSGDTALCNIAKTTQDDRARFNREYGDSLLLMESPIPFEFGTNGRYFDIGDAFFKDTNFVDGLRHHLLKFPERAASILGSLLRSRGRRLSETLLSGMSPFIAVMDTTQKHEELNLLQIACINGHSRAVGSLSYLAPCLTVEGFTLPMLACGAVKGNSEPTQAERADTLIALADFMKEKEEFGKSDRSGRDALHYARALPGGGAVVVSWLRAQLGLIGPAAPVFTFGSNSNLPTQQAGAPSPFGDIPNPFAGSDDLGSGIKNPFA